MQISEDYIIDFVSENDENKVIITIHRQGQTAVNVFAYYMLSDSMTPALESRKIYYVEKTEKAPKKGDIVLAYAPEYDFYILHRVIGGLPLMAIYLKVTEMKFPITEHLKKRIL